MTSRWREQYARALALFGVSLHAQPAFGSALAALIFGLLILWQAAHPSVGSADQAASWARVADLPTPRYALAAARGGDGRIYAVGGVSASDLHLARVDAYDPRSNTWTAVAPMSVARGALAAVTGANGHVYAIGG